MRGVTCALSICGFGFEAFCLPSSRSVKEEQAVAATYCQSLDELLRESDFVVLAVNLTPETRGLIGHRELSLMKSTATLVNVSRGDSCVFHGLKNIIFFSWPVMSLFSPPLTSQVWWWIRTL